MSETIEKPTSLGYQGSQTIQHLNSYPIVKEFITFVYSTAILSQILNAVKPYFNYFESLVLSIVVVHTTLANIDAFIDQYVLNKLDALVPSLKTFESKDLNVHPPSYIFAKLKENFFSYEKTIRPNVVTKIDPFIKPVNNQIETLVTSYLPETPEQETVEASDELARLYTLTKKAYKNTLPIASTEISQIQKHVLDTYSANLPESTSTPVDRFQAAVKTTSQLSSESLGLFNKTYKNVKPNIPSTFNVNIAGVKIKIGKSIDNVKNNVDASFAEGAEGAKTAIAESSAGSY